QHRPGDDAAWAKWEGDPPADGLATFAKIESASEVERTLRKLADDAGPLSPAESFKRFKVPDDLALDLVLSDPTIGQPLHMSSDERGRLWLVQYLLFYPDRNNDDVPDGPPEVHLEGFGLEDSHSVVSNLTFGPDGWLYACQGSTVSGNVKRPGKKAKDGKSDGKKSDTIKDDIV